MDTDICILAAPLLIQTPANVRRKEVDDGSSSWILATHIRDTYEARGLGIQLGSALAIVAIWQMN